LSVGLYGAVAGALAEPADLGRVVNVKIGPANCVVAEFQAEAQQGVEHDAVLRGDPVEIAFEEGKVAGERALVGRPARRPFVAVADGGDQAEYGGTQTERLAARDAAREIRRQVVEALKNRIIGVHQLLSDRSGIDVAGADALTTREERREGR